MTDQTPTLEKEEVRQGRRKIGMPTVLVASTLIAIGTLLVVLAIV